MVSWETAIGVLCAQQMTELTTLNQKLKILKWNKNNSLDTWLLGALSTCVLMITNFYYWTKDKRWKYGPSACKADILSQFQESNYRNFSEAALLSSFSTREAYCNHTVTWLLWGKLPMIQHWKSAWSYLLIGVLRFPNLSSCSNINYSSVLLNRHNK